MRGLLTAFMMFPSKETENTMARDGRGTLESV